MVVEILLGVFLLLSFLVVLTTQRLILRKIRMLILDFPRLDHDKVLNTRKEQSAVPQGFETWNWKTEEVHSPWRGPMTLEWTSGEIPERTAIFVHGTATNRFSMIRYMRPYKDLGFNLVFYDHPGHGLHQDPPPSYGWYEKGELDFVVDRVREHFPQTNLWVFHGESLGSGVIMDYLGAYPPNKKENRLGVLDCGYTDFSQLINHHLKRWGLPGIIRKWALKKTRKLLLRRSLAPLESLTPGKSVQNTCEPLLLIHGLEDIRVPFFMSQNLYDSRKNIAYTELHLVPGARHCSSWLMDPQLYDKWVRDFILSQGSKNVGN